MIRFIKFRIFVIVWVPTVIATALMMLIIAMFTSESVYNRIDDKLRKTLDGFACWMVRLLGLGE